jgi:hypothetical protein
MRKQRIVHSMSDNEFRNMFHQYLIKHGFQDWADELNDMRLRAIYPVDGDSRFSVEWRFMWENTDGD